MLEWNWVERRAADDQLEIFFFVSTFHFSQLSSLCSIFLSRYSLFMLHTSDRRHGARRNFSCCVISNVVDATAYLHNEHKLSTRWISNLISHRSFFILPLSLFYVFVVLSTHPVCAHHESIDRYKLLARHMKMRPRLTDEGNLIYILGTIKFHWSFSLSCCWNDLINFMLTHSEWSAALSRSCCQLLGNITHGPWIKPLWSSKSLNTSTARSREHCTRKTQNSEKKLRARVFDRYRHGTYNRRETTKSLLAASQLREFQTPAQFSLKFAGDRSCREQCSSGLFATEIIKSCGWHFTPYIRCHIKQWKWIVKKFWVNFRESVRKKVWEEITRK